MYNPYEMIEIVLNGQKSTARPYEFDSDVVDQKNMKNAFGTYVKPIKAITTCNKCGQAIHINLELPDPPFGVIQASCMVCEPSKKMEIVNPFVNPVLVNAVSRIDLDPLVYDPRKPVEPVTTTVAERQEKKKKASKPKQEKNAQEEAKEVPKGQKESAEVPKKQIDKPKAEGLEAEQSFDDNDLIEP